MTVSSCRLGPPAKHADRLDAAIRELLFIRNGGRPAVHVITFMRKLVLGNLHFGEEKRDRVARMPGLRRAISEYLDWECRLAEGPRRKIRLVGQEAWSDTSLAEKQRVSVGKSIRRVLQSSGSLLSDIDTLVDLGCGDGQATCNFLGTIRPFCNVQNVLLVDQAAAAIRTAGRAVREYVSRGTSVNSLQCDIRSAEIWKNIHGRQIVVFASGSLHEVRAASKLELLRTIGRIAQVFVLVELLANHEAPRTGNICLLQEAARFYESLIADAYRSLSDAVERKHVIGGFLLAELLDIWTLPLAFRGNYHLPIEGWEKLLVRAGLLPVVLERISMTKGGLEGMCLLATGHVAENQRRRY